MTTYSVLMPEDQGDPLIDIHEGIANFLIVNWRGDHLYYNLGKHKSRYEAIEINSSWPYSYTSRLMHLNEIEIEKLSQKTTIPLEELLAIAFLQKKEWHKIKTAANVPRSFPEWNG